MADLERLFLEDGPAVDAARAQSTACLVRVVLGPRRADVPVPAGRWQTHTLADVVAAIRALWHVTGDVLLVDAAGSTWGPEERTRDYLLCQLVDGRGPLEVVEAAPADAVVDEFLGRCAAAPGWGAWADRLQASVERAAPQGARASAALPPPRDLPRRLPPAPGPDWSPGRGSAEPRVAARLPPVEEMDRLFADVRRAAERAAALAKPGGGPAEAYTLRSPLAERGPAAAAPVSPPPPPLREPSDATPWRPQQQPSPAPGGPTPPTARYQPQVPESPLLRKGVLTRSPLRDQLSPGQRVRGAYHRFWSPTPREQGSPEERQRATLQRFRVRMDEVHRVLEQSPLRAAAADEA